MIRHLQFDRCTRVFLATAIAFALGVPFGCTPSTYDSTTKSDAKSEPEAKVPSTASLSDTSNSQTAGGGVADGGGASEGGPASPDAARRLLSAALGKYRTFDSYSDAGELHIERSGGPGLKIPFRVAFERPNRLAVASHNAVGSWTSTTWEGICGEPMNPFPNQRLVRPLPDRIDYRWVVNDYLGGLLIEPFVLPIQMEWLLSDQSMDSLKGGNSKLEFLQRDSVDGNSCDRVRMELNGQAWVFWVDRENQLVRRIELPSNLLSPGASVDPLLKIRYEIDLRDAVANQPIDWTRWRIPDRPEDVRVRRLVMPPPITSTQILGSTLEPFDLKSAEGELLLDAAEPKRPVSVLCWIDSSPRSEACVRELMVLQKALSEQEWGGRIGIYLIGREPSEELIESLKKWNCDLPLAVDRQNLTESLFRISFVPSIVMMDRERRVQVSETLVQPMLFSSFFESVRRIDNKEDLASRQLQRDADNQARFIAALHRAAIDRDQVKRLDSIREFQFALHGMRRMWRTEIDVPPVSAGGAWFPEAAVSSVDKSVYPFTGSGKPIVMSVLDETGRILVLDDLGNKQLVGKVEIEQADGAKRIHMSIDPWTQKWIAVVPEGLPRFWVSPLKFDTPAPPGGGPSATTYNTGDAESPVAFAWAPLNGQPAIAVATSESRIMVINPANEKRLDALGEATIGIAPSLDSGGHVTQWNAISAKGRMVKIRNLTGENAVAAESPIEARLEQLTFVPRAGSWLWGCQDREPVSFCLMDMPSGEIGVAVCNIRHEVIRDRPLIAIGEQSRLLSTVRLEDGTLYCLALAPNRVLHLLTSDLRIVDQVSFGSRVFGAALFADGNDLKMVVALENEVSAWSIDVPARPGAAAESIAPGKQ